MNEFNLKPAAEKKRRLKSLNLFFTGLYSFMLLLVLLILPGLCPARELSFESAAEMMKKNNESIIAAEMEHKTREHEKNAARGLYLPTLKASARYTKINDAISIDLNGIRTVMLQLHGIPEGSAPASMIPDFKMEVQNDTFVNSSLDISWPIFTGGRIRAANKTADAKTDEAKEALRNTRANLLGELVERYFGVRLSGKVLEVRKDFLKGMEQHLYEAAQLEKNGIISNSEKLHAQVARVEAERELKKAERDLTILRTALKNTLALNNGEEEAIETVSPLFLTKSLPPLKEFIDIALLKNPLLKQLEAKKKQAAQGVNYSRGKMMPEVYLFGVKELYREDLTTLDPEWAVGFGINIPVFEGFSAANRLRAAKNIKARVGYIEKKARRDIATLTEKRYHEVMKQIEQFEALDASLDLAMEALRVRRRAFEEGYATSLDVVDAHLTLSGVQIKRYVSVYEFDVALLRLLEASGTSEEFNHYRTGKNVEVRF